MMACFVKPHPFFLEIFLLLKRRIRKRERETAKERERLREREGRGEKEREREGGWRASSFSFYEAFSMSFFSF